MMSLSSPRRARRREEMDIEIRNARSWYFQHHRNDTVLATLFNDLLKCNGTYEQDYEADQRREDTARKARTER